MAEKSVNLKERSIIMTRHNVFKQNNKFAVIGLILDLPALFIVSMGVLQSVLNMPDLSKSFMKGIISPQSPMLHPFVVLGGILCAIAMNSIAIFRVRLEPQNSTIVTTITTELKLFNLAVLGLSSFLLCAILLYAFGENFMIVAR